MALSARTTRLVDRCNIPVIEAILAEQPDREPRKWICCMDVDIRQTVGIADYVQAYYHKFSTRSWGTRKSHAGAGENHMHFDVGECQ